ncbi:metaxin-3 [Diabrotica virgifera virgifera]|uniref:Metaxin-3-like n=2 Tax=Diabrotica virgifera virgifera TaxID=50390 RepID=A0A6P7H814_DIAVI|nr:metaxin-3 [Diabrotica virgifera virgifera]
MDQKHKFQLIVFDGDFSLPSIDPESIKSILYTAVAGVPVEVRLFNNFKNCTLYTAPTFIHKNLKFKTFSDLVLYLKTLHFNLDENLTPKEASESLALTNLVQSKLRPLLEYYYWADVRNTFELTNIWFMRSLPIPFNYIYTRRFRDRAVDLLESLHPTETNFDLIKEYVQRAATECLSNLSTRLGNENYFYGNSPTTIDVLVYSYIAPLLKVPFPSNEIKNVLSMWPNLANLVKRIDDQYFPNLPKGSKYIKIEEKVKTSDDEVSYMAILILTVSATSLVFGFAYSRGYLSQ